MDTVEPESLEATGTHQIFLTTSESEISAVKEEIIKKEYLSEEEEEKIAPHFVDLDIEAATNTASLNIDEIKVEPLQEELESKRIEEESQDTGESEYIAIAKCKKKRKTIKITS